MENDLQYLLVSLNIISKIKVNDKIYINTNGSITTYKDSKINSFFRWMHGENRIKTCSFITNIINQCISTINLLQLSTNNIESQYRSQLVLQMNTCSVGLECLKITYNNDVYVHSVIDTILNKIRIHCELDLMTVDDFIVRKKQN